MVYDVDMDGQKKRRFKAPDGDNGTCPIRCQVRPEERERLRVVAAKAGVSMAKFVRELVRKAIEGPR